VRHLLPVERTRESEVRRVPCPNCRRQPGRPCQYDQERVPWSSHTGRYLLAVAAGLVPPLVGFGSDKPIQPGSPVPSGPKPSPGPRPTPTHPGNPRPTRAA
jgi:hypothetical protein